MKQLTDSAFTEVETKPADASDATGTKETCGTDEESKQVVGHVQSTVSGDRTSTPKQLAAAEDCMENAAYQEKDSSKNDAIKKVPGSDEDVKHASDQLQPTASSTNISPSEQPVVAQDCKENAAYQATKIRADLTVTAVVPVASESSPHIPVPISKNSEATATDNKPASASNMATADSDTDMDLTTSTRYSSKKKHRRISELIDTDSDAMPSKPKRRKNSSVATRKAGKDDAEKTSKQVTEQKTKPVALKNHGT